MQGKEEEKRKQYKNFNENLVTCRNKLFLLFRKMLKLQCPQFWGNGGFQVSLVITGSVQEPIVFSLCTSNSKVGIKYTQRTWNLLMKHNRGKKNS